MLTLYGAGVVVVLLVVAVGIARMVGVVADVVVVLPAVVIAGVAAAAVDGAVAIAVDVVNGTVVASRANVGVAGALGLSPLVSMARDCGVSAVARWLLLE